MKIITLHTLGGAAVVVNAERILYAVPVNRHTCLVLGPGFALDVQETLEELSRRLAAEEEA